MLVLGERGEQNVNNPSVPLEKLANQEQTELRESSREEVIGRKAETDEKGRERRSLLADNASVSTEKPKGSKEASVSELSRMPSVKGCGVPTALAPPRGSEPSSPALLPLGLGSSQGPECGLWPHRLSGRGPTIGHRDSSSCRAGVMKPPASPSPSVWTHSIPVCSRRTAQPHPTDPLCAGQRKGSVCQERGCCAPEGWSLAALSLQGLSSRAPGPSLRPAAVRPGRGGGFGNHVCV